MSNESSTEIHQVGITNVAHGYLAIAERLDLDYYAEIAFGLTR